MAKKKVFSIGSSLTNGLEETFASAKNYAGELRYDIVPIGKLELDPDNPRELSLTFKDAEIYSDRKDLNFSDFKNKDIQSLLSLSLSIQNQGLLNPIIVYEHNGKYRVLAGERRTLASIMAGKNEIQAKILDSRPDDLKIRILQWVENIERSDLSLWEKISNLEKIVLEYGKSKGSLPSAVTLKELGDLIGCEKSQANKYKLLLLADDQLKQLIKNNEIKNLDKAALLASIENKLKRDEVTQACLEGLSFNQLKTLSNEKNAKFKPIPTGTKRGREAVRINFGVTKNLDAGRLILESIINNPKLAQVTSDINIDELDSYQAMSNIFKAILERLENMNDIVQLNKLERINI